MEFSDLVQDRSKLLAKFGNSAPMLAQILTVYLESWRSDYQGLQQALESGDFPQAAKMLHRLKGSVGYFATDQLFQQVQELEAETKKGHLEESRELTPALYRSLEDADEQLQAIRGSLT